MTIINTRSPYFIKVTPSVGNLISAEMQLYIYTGEFQSTPTELRYTLTKTPIGTNNFVVFEISELIRDYLELEFNGDYNSYAVWVRPVFEITYIYTSGEQIETPTPIDYIGINGYGYFEQGANYTLTDEIGLMMTNRTLYVQSNYDLHVPVFSHQDTTIDFYCGNELVHTATTATATNTNNMIVYAQLENVENYQNRVETAGGTFVGSTCLTSFMEELESCVTKVVVNTSQSSTTIDVNYITECRYTPYRVTFVNKFGAFQDIWFFKKSTEKTNVKSEQYKSSVFDLSTLSYKTYQHQQQEFLVNGKDSITMNTGYVNDDYNSVIEELLLSEQVWFSDGVSQTIPLNVQTKSVTYKTSNNNKLINHTIEFTKSFDKINNIR